nr:hypothetical protein [Nanoarchaeum sp.]
MVDSEDKNIFLNQLSLAILYHQSQNDRRWGNIRTKHCHLQEHYGCGPRALDRYYRFPHQLPEEFDPGIQFGKDLEKGLASLDN